MNKMDNKLKKEFANPSDEFTPIPFWFWNDNLEEQEIIRQINNFKQKGIMGFFIHPRIGIPEHIEYLSDEFMELVKCAVQEAAKLGMKVILYDEGMYPSGSAHGMVVKDDPQYASRGLKMVEYQCKGMMDIKLDIQDGEYLISILAVQKKGDKAVYKESIRKLELIDGSIVFEAPNSEDWAILVFVEVYSRGTIRGIHVGEDDGQKNAPPSADLLNADAIKKFIMLTHHRYYEVLKEYFGTTIIAMFTDEPGILGRCLSQQLIPWTRDFLHWYIEQGNSEFDLPVFWLEVGEDTQIIRKKYRKAVNKKLEQSYYRPISTWCEQHGIALTGHPEKSDEIGFLKYFHIPGQDIVWRWVGPEDGKGIDGEHSTMGKCSSDAARHGGRRRNANECFGCCGPNGIQWAFSAGDMKWYLDWLFVRGVNMIYPHAFYYSVNGQVRYGERPPDVGPNNIWWEYYNTISDYIKRMSWLMTNSINQTNIAVLCQEDHLPWKIVKPLYQNQIEFNYLEDRLLESHHCSMIDGKITIEHQLYSIIIIENIDTIFQTTKKILQAFVNAGGEIIIYNPDNKKMELQGVKQVSQYDNIIETIDNMMIRAVNFYPHCEELRISHVAKEDVHYYLMVNEGEEKIQGELAINTLGRIEKWDAWKGTMEEICVEVLEDSGVKFALNIDRRESVIIFIDPKGQPTKIDDKSLLNQKVVEKEISVEWEVSDLNDNICYKVNSLKSWTQLDKLENYCGTLNYHSVFNYNDVEKASKVEIDLGKVHEIAHVYINNCDAGVKMWSPYRVDITNFIQQGLNSIKIEITNSMANRYEQVSLESGLIGPIRILVTQNN